MIYNYIVIEGNIGSGKTSLAQQIARDHQARMILERFEDNSFLPKFYQDPDQYAFPLEMSFLADRFQQLKEELRSGQLFSPFTVADYFIDKSLIFARQTLKKDEYTLYSRLFDIISASLPRPDLVVYLYNNIPNLLRNIRNRGRSYEQDMQAAYLEKIQQGYFDYFRNISGRRILIVDAQELDFVGSGSDYRRICAVIFKEYAPGVHRITF